MAANNKVTERRAKEPSDIGYFRKHSKASAAIPPSTRTFLKKVTEQPDKMRNRISGSAAIKLKPTVFPVRHEFVRNKRPPDIRTPQWLLMI